jgi:DNA-binding NtrC family response regulator
MTMRVLVFDDDAAIGRLVVRVATMAGMEAVAVTDAEAFGQHLRTDPPQVVPSMMLWCELDPQPTSFCCPLTALRSSLRC